MAWDLSKMSRSRKIEAGIAVVVLAVLVWLITVWKHEAFYTNRSMLDYASNRWTTLWFGDVLERESRRLAGPGAVNCGRAPAEAAEKVNDCILRAAQQKQRPFWGSYTMGAIDYSVETAVVGTVEGRTYEITFMEGPYVPPESRFSRAECPQPRTLKLTDPRDWDQGRLTCEKRNEYGPTPIPR